MNFKHMGYKTISGDSRGNCYRMALSNGAKGDRSWIRVLKYD
jgi:hypothetical protein